MKKIIILVAIGVVLFAMVGGCSSVRCHRPEFYNRTGTEVGMEVAGSTILTQGLTVYSTTTRYLRVYPECAEFNTSQSDLMECILQIDIKEGRITSGYVEPKRTNMDEVIGKGRD